MFFSSPGFITMPYEMANLVLIPEIESPDCTNQLLSSVEEKPPNDIWMTPKLRLTEPIATRGLYPRAEGGSSLLFSDVPVQAN